MPKDKKFKLKSFLFLFFIIVIAISFVFLKVKQKYQARNFVDRNEIPQEQLEERTLIAKHSSKMLKFNDLKEFSSFVEKNKLEMTSAYEQMKMVRGFGVDMVNEIAFNSADSVSDSVVSPLFQEAEAIKGDEGSDSLDFSTTNIQVQGVDEADIVKTDGEYVYYVSGQSLYILKSYPVEEAEIIGQINFKTDSADVYVQDIYVKDDTLVIFGEEFEKYGDDFSKLKIGYIMPRFSQVFLQTYNMSDRSNPVKEKDIKMDGVYFNSRLIGDHLYFLVNNYNYYDYYDGVLPRMTYQGREVNYDCQSGLKCLPSEIYYFDDYYNQGFDLTSIVSFKITDKDSEPKNYFYLLPSGQNLYVSRGNIYLTYTKYLNEYEIETDALLDLVYPRLSDKDKKNINDIKAVADNILSLSEKRGKIRRILDLYVSLLSVSEREILQKDLDTKVLEKYPNILDELEKTVIHKLAIFNSSVEPIFMAEVPGSVLNQFSMDEFDGFFRIATTRNQVWSRFVGDNEAYKEETESHNNLYILDSNLEPAGEIKGLAKGERIYSVRFMGDKAYIVTFKQVDPLFSINLKDPYNPKVLGELKIPGFSNYLHPYSKDMLIGFGKDTEESQEGQVITKGLKLSLFDVSSDDPKELDSYTIGDAGSDSIALYDHRAFLFSKDKNILIVPTILRDKVASNDWGKVSFNGLLVFNIIDNKFVLQGKIAHTSPAVEDYYLYSVQRSLFIQDNLFSFSRGLIKINKLENLEDISSFKLEDELVIVE